MKTAREILHKHTADETAIDYLRDIIVECMEEYASQLTPKIPKIEWRDDVGIAYCNNIKVGLIRTVVWHPYNFVSVDLEKREQVHITKSEAKTAVEQSFKDFISKVVVMEQISDEEIEEEARKCEDFRENEPEIVQAESAGRYHGFIACAKWLRDKQKG
ncbi:MAG: hypothetical protein H8E34_10975 [Bacteroidetes bacterium]|nr:hypothetical protein [Bacteroidota bacterium]